MLSQSLNFQIILSIFLGYIFGCIQTSYFIGKFRFQVDVKSAGSKNAGASNGVMLFGWKYGIFIGLVDIFKAYIPTVFILTLYPNNMLLASLAGGGAILGHIYPFFMGFNGGKGALATRPRDSIPLENFLIGDSCLEPPTILFNM